MEFGTSARVDSGANVVGVSWTSPSVSEDASWLVTTTEGRVAVTRADDRVTLLSWITRASAHNKFTVAAVQNRRSRRFLAVQSASRLFAWHEGDASLEAATKRQLPGDVAALRVNRKLALTAVVYTDGGVAFVDDALRDVAALPGRTDGGVARWARLTKVPGDDTRFLLMVLLQPAAPASTPASAPAPASLDPYILTYILRARPTPTPAAPAAGAGDDPTVEYALKLAAVHTLHAPPPLPAAPHAPSPAGAPTVVCVSLHKAARALSVVWSTGALQVLSFSATAPAWYTTPLRQTVLQHVARLAPAPPAPGAAGAAPAAAGATPGQCAAFALEPACLVLAAAAQDGARPGMVALSVWDVRYGVMLAAKVIDAEGEDAPAGVSPPLAPAAAPGSRARTASTSLSTPTAPPAAEAVFQVLVSEDAAHVAVASRRRVLLTDVAARGASLLSAIGRAAPTRALLQLPAATGGDITTAVPPTAARFLPPAGLPAAAAVPLAACIARAGAAAGGGGGAVAWDLTDGTDAAARGRAAAWGAALAAAQAALAADCTAVMSPTAAPSSATLLPLVHKYVPAAGAGAAPAAPTAAPASKRGRARSASVSLAEPTRPDAAAPAPPVARSEPPVPPAFVIAVAARCAAELVSDGVASEAASGTPDFDFRAVLTPLLQAGVVSAASSPQLLAALAHAALRAPDGGRGTDVGSKRKRGAVANEAGSAALFLLADALQCVTDLPEAFLVRLFVDAAHRAPRSRLVRLWHAAAGTAGDDSAATDADALAYFTGLLVAAQRNDVFLERALAALAVEDVTLLLSCLLRLLRVVASLPPTTAAASPPATATPLRLPAPAQVLDWLRMTFDAHFARLALACRAAADGAPSAAAASAGVRDLLADVVAAVRQEAAASEAAATVRGQLLHLFAGGPLPLPPAPDHLVDVLLV